MSTDLKIEAFGCYIFDDAFLEYGVIEEDSNSFQIYYDEFVKDKSVVEACDNAFLDVYYSRDSLFRNIYTEEIDFEEVKSWKCLSDCYDHVTRVCDREDLFGHLNIFDRMFATCTYVVNLCECIYKDTVIDVSNYGHIIWAMYFDQFSERFYKEGGWNELKRVSNGYQSLYDFLIYFEEEDLQFLKEASINFCRFRMNLKFQEKTIHISKLWVKFHVMHFDEYITMPWYEKLVNCLEIEKLLQDLKCICNCSLEFEVIKDIILQYNFLSDNSDLKTCDMYESIETIDDECQTTMQCYETWIKKGCAASALLDNDENCESDKNGSFVEGISDSKTSAVLDKHSTIGLNNLRDANLCSETNPEKSEKTATLDLNEKYIASNRKNKREYTISNTLGQSDTIKASSMLSTLRNHNEELERSRKFSPDNLPSSSYLCSDNQVNKYDTKESSRSPMHSNFSKKTELCNESMKLTDFTSTNKTSANHRKGNAIQKTLNSSKDSSVGIKITNKCDGKMNTEIRPDKLRQEQNDPEMRQFLRMILVLGDKQGIQYVCSTICNRERGMENSRGKLNNGKKRHQKKSRK